MWAGTNSLLPELIALLLILKILPGITGLRRDYFGVKVLLPRIMTAVGYLLGDRVPALPAPSVSATSKTVAGDDEVSTGLAATTWAEFSGGVGTKTPCMLLRMELMELPGVTFFALVMETVPASSLWSIIRCS